MPLFKSTFLKELEATIIKYVASDRPIVITKSDGTPYTLSWDDINELKNFFGIAQTALIKQEFQNTNTSQMIVLQKRQDDKFRREIERTLFKSLYPNNWQMGVLIRSLNTFLRWKDKRQRAIIVPYEPYILRALKSLQERKKQWDKKIGWPSNDLEG